MRMSSSNPVMSDRIFQSAHAADSNVMTVQGTGIKTTILIVLAFVAAAFSWSTCLQNPGLYPAFIWGGGIAGLVLVLVASFKPTTSPFTAPAYAVAEGLALGAISVLVSKISPKYADLPFQAVCLTFGTLFSMGIVYSNGWIKVTDKLRTGLYAALGAIFLIYLLTFILGFFSVQIPYIHGSGPIGIGFSVVVVGVAAFFLLLDFDFIERGAQYGAPKYMEWYGALGLMVTLVWLYLEILRLLMKIQNRR